MKLKKIVSLALAGVLAVSMLAGCSNGTGSSSSTPTQEAPSTAAAMTNSVIAELDKEITDRVTFTYDASLESDVKKLIAYAGYEHTGGNITQENLAKINSNLSDAALPALQSQSDIVGVDNGEYTATVVAVVEKSDVNFSAAKIAAQVKTAGATLDGTNGIEALPMKGNDLKDAADKNCYYTFKYTGKMAVVALDDTLGTTTGYVVAYTVTRTASKVALPET